MFDHETFGRRLKACNGRFHRTFGNHVDGMLVPIQHIREWKRTYFVYAKNDNPTPSLGKMKWTSAMFVLDDTTASRSIFPYRVDITQAGRNRTFFSLLQRGFVEAKIGPCVEFERGWNKVDAVGFTTEENAIVGQILVDRHVADLKVFERA